MIEAAIIADILGVAGALCVVLAYSLLQFEKVTPRTYTYNLVNLAGALLLFVSLLINFNLGSFIIEIVWISVSIYGLYQTYKESNEATNKRRFKNRN